MILGTAYYIPQRPSAFTGHVIGLMGQHFPALDRMWNYCHMLLCTIKALLCTIWHNIDSVGGRSPASHEDHSCQLGLRVSVSELTIMSINTRQLTCHSCELEWPC